MRTEGSGSRALGSDVFAVGSRSSGRGARQSRAEACVRGRIIDYVEDIFVGKNPDKGNGPHVIYRQLPSLARNA